LGLLEPARNQPEGLDVEERIRTPFCLTRSWIETSTGYPATTRPSGEIARGHVHHAHLVPLAGEHALVLVPLGLVVLGGGADEPRGSRNENPHRYLMLRGVRVYGEEDRKIKLILVLDARGNALVHEVTLTSRTTPEYDPALALLERPASKSFR
jgi:hypothetical protein